MSLICLEIMIVLVLLCALAGCTAGLLTFLYGTGIAYGFNLVVRYPEGVGE